MFETYPEAAAQQARTGIGPADPMTMPIATARLQQDRYFQTLNARVPTVAAVRNLTVAGPHGEIGVRLVYPDTRPELSCIVFLRGAGFWAGGLDSHASTTHALANFSGCVVCAVDYHRTPEHAFPVQRDEVLAVLRWLREEGARHGLCQVEPVLFGESAGATICLSVALALRDASLPPPKGMVLFYNNAAGPKATSRPYSRWVWKQYLGERDGAAPPGAVPMREGMAGLPAIWLGCGEDDPLLEDTLALSAKLAAEGVVHTLARFPGMPHAFLMFSATLRPAFEALRQAADAARAFHHSPPKD